MINVEKLYLYETATERLFASEYIDVMNDSCLVGLRWYKV